MIKRLFPVLSLVTIVYLFFGSQLLAAFKAYSSQVLPKSETPTTSSSILENQGSVQSFKDVSTSNKVSSKVNSKVTDQTTDPDRLEIQLSQRRVTLYWNNTPVSSYPIAVGRQGWETPTGQFRVAQMRENPKWINPLTDHAIAGGAPGNPLGSYWIGFWTDGKNWIGLHGSPDRASIGKAISHGCIRMYNEDIEQLYSLVNEGTQVIVKP